MNKSMLALIVGGVLTGGAAQAEIRDDAWYVGGKIGWSSYFDVDQKQVVADTLGELENTHSGKDALGLGGFAGYQVNPNLAFEFGYDWLGKYTSSGELSGVNIAGEAKSQMVQATMKMGFPVNPLIELYGRIGGGYAWTHSNLSAEAEGNYVSEKRKDHGAVFVGALGAEYALNERWAARLEYQYTTPLGDASLDRAGIEMDNGLLSLGVRYRLNQAEVVAPAPAPAPAPAEQVPVVEQKTFSLSSDVLFEFNKATLKQAGHQALDMLFSQIIAANPKDGLATIVGYTDRIGSDSYNLSLSEQRARSVADYLVSKGLYSDKVRIEGRGKANPVTEGRCISQSRQQLISCLAPDRRVEIHLEGISLPQE